LSESPTSPGATYLRLTLSVLFWGGTFVAGRLVTREMAPETAAFIRFFIASVLLLMILLHREGRLPRLNRTQALGMLLLGLTGVFAYNLFFFNALKSVEAGRAALIIASNPVFIAIFSFFLFRERFPPLKILGILVSVSGAMVVIARGDPQLLFQEGIGSGELFLVGCVFSWVAYTLIGKQVLSGMTPLTAVTYSCIAGSLMLLVPALMHGLPEAVGSLSWTSAGSLLYLSMLGTVVGFVWFYRGVDEIGPTRAGLFINLVPVSGVALGILVLGEQPGISLFIGGALVITGLFLTNRCS